MATMVGCSGHCDAVIGWHRAGFRLYWRWRSQPRGGRQKVHADRAYRRARGITGSVGALEANYISGVMQGLDTTMDITTEQESAIQRDFNNTVIHGKSTALLNALESVIGAETFEKLYHRCLKDHAGKTARLARVPACRGKRERAGSRLVLQQWVPSSDSAAYQVAGKECSPAGGEFDCRVQLKRIGGMRMPVTVVVRFEDGSEQRAQTERLANVDELKFRAKAQIKEV